MDKVFIDSDIILDLIQERDHYSDAMPLFTLIEENKAKGYVSVLYFKKARIKRFRLACSNAIKSIAACSHH
jgi:hypothetical protein